MRSNIFYWALSNLFNWSNLRAFFVGSLATRERQELTTLYAGVEAAYQQSRFAGADAEIELVESIVDEAFRRFGHSPGKALRDAACELSYRLLIDEPVTIGMPEMPGLNQAALPAMQALRKILIVKQRVLADPDFYLKICREKIVGLLEGLAPYMPPFAFGDVDSSPYSISLIDVCEKAGEAIERTFATFYDDDIVNAGLFDTVRTRLDDNLCYASGMTKVEAQRTGRKPLLPTEAKGKTSRDLVAGYLSGTPFAAFFMSAIPFAIPTRYRFEHAHLLGGSGHGKTQFLQHLVMNDLESADPPALIIIDSQGDMLRKIQRLSVFSPGGPLADKLLIVDPEDECAPSLNMFDTRTTRLSSYSRNLREQIEAEVIELYNYIFGSLAAEMTSKQSTAFAFIVRLMLSIPGATIHTLLGLMEEDTKSLRDSKFLDAIMALDPTARSFFENQFMNRSAFGQTRQQIARRLYGVLQVPAFDRMFSATQNRLDMFDAMQRGNIVLVNTSKPLLKSDASALFGRYMIAQTLAAAFERIAVPQSQRRPAFLIIDEAADYFDANLETILAQARKFNLGVLFAHQHLEQLNPALRASVAANTSIKFAGGVSDRDARALAADMRTTPEFIAATRKHDRSSEFACYVRNLSPGALRLAIPFGTLEAAPRMSDDDFREIIARNRKRLASNEQSRKAPEPQTQPEVPKPPAQSDAAAEW